MYLHFLKFSRVTFQSFSRTRYVYADRIASRKVNLGKGRLEREKKEAKEREKLCNKDRLRVPDCFIAGSRYTILASFSALQCFTLL